MEFPTIHKVLKTGMRVEHMDGTTEDRADDGTLRLRRLYSEDRYRISFQLCQMTGDDVEGVRQFYRSYRNQEITWTNPFTSVTYEGYMISPPQVIGDVVGPYGIMEVYFEGTVQ